MPNPFYYLIHESNIQWIKVEDACWGETLKYNKFFKGQTDNHQKHSSSTSRVELTENKNKEKLKYEGAYEKAINGDTGKYLSSFCDHRAPFSPRSLYPSQSQSPPFHPLCLCLPQQVTTCFPCSPVSSMASFTYQPWLPILFAVSMKLLPSQGVPPGHVMPYCF